MPINGCTRSWLFVDGMQPIILIGPCTLCGAASFLVYIMMLPPNPIAHRRRLASVRGSSWSPIGSNRKQMRNLQSIIGFHNDSINITLSYILYTVFQPFSTFFHKLDKTSISTYIYPLENGALLMLCEFRLDLSTHGIVCSLPLLLGLWPSIPIRHQAASVFDQIFYRQIMVKINWGEMGKLSTKLEVNK